MKINKVRGENMIAGPSVRRWQREQERKTDKTWDNEGENDRRRTNLPALLIAVKENLRVALIKQNSRNHPCFSVFHPVSCLFL